MKFILDYNRDYLLEMAKTKKAVEQDLLNSEEQRIINLMQIFIIRGQNLKQGSDAHGRHFVYHAAAVCGDGRHRVSGGCVRPYGNTIKKQSPSFSGWQDN